MWIVDLRLAVLRAMVTPIRSRMEFERKLLVVDEFADMLAPAWLLGPMIGVTLSADCRTAGATPDQVAGLRGPADRYVLIGTPQPRLCSC